MSEESPSNILSEMVSKYISSDYNNHSYIHRNEFRLASNAIQSVAPIYKNHEINNKLITSQLNKMLLLWSKSISFLRSDIDTNNTDHINLIKSHIAVAILYIKHFIFRSTLVKDYSSVNFDIPIANTLINSRISSLKSKNSTKIFLHISEDFN
jgi:hypothetical protein